MAQSIPTPAKPAPAPAPAKSSQPQTKAPIFTDYASI